MLLSYEYQEQYADLGNGINRILIRKDCFELLMTHLSNQKEEPEGFEEETQSYFSGKKDIDKTVQMIQNRCLTYMSEQR